MSTTISQSHQTADEQRQIAYKLWVDAWDIYLEQTEIATKEFESSLPAQRIVRKLENPNERKTFISKKAKEIAMLKTFCLLGASILQQTSQTQVHQIQLPPLTDEQVESLLPTEKADEI